MSKNLNEIPDYGQRVSIPTLISNLLHYRLMIVAIIFVVAGAGILAAIVMKPVYRSEVLMVVISNEPNQGGMAALASQFGGLASLAGISVGSESRKDEALATLRSRAFTQSFIERENLMPVLFADEWDSDANEWLAESVDEVPSPADGYKKFDENVRFITENSNNDLVRLSIEWTDRHLAAQWANALVRDLNFHIRSKDIAEAEASIKYLNAEIEKNSVLQLQQGMFSLIEMQIEKIMLANVRDEYVLKVIDPAVPADLDDFVRPRRLLIVSMSLIIGVMIAVFLALVRNSLRIGGLRAD